MRFRPPRTVIYLASPAAAAGRRLGLVPSAEGDVWLARHPRFQMHFTPVHCSWMNQVEQWFSVLQRKRMTASNFQDLADLEAKVTAFIAEWNETAHPFDWSKTSFTKILDKVEAELHAAA